MTGGAGYIGSTLARQLRDEGWQVCVLDLPRADRRNLDGLDYQWVPGDVSNEPDVNAAVEGCEFVFHLAAHNQLWARSPAVHTRSILDGTRIVLDASRRYRVKRVVYTSTCEILSRCNGRPAAEAEVRPFSTMVGSYMRSKYLADELARFANDDGLEVVIVYPTVPIGEGDVNLTGPGRMVSDFLRRRLPAYVDTGINLIDVRDCARGHLLAATRGTPGGLYILAGENVPLQDLFRLLEELSGVPGPRHKVPYALALLAAHVDEWVADHITGRPPRAPVSGVVMTRPPFYFDNRRAVDELGLNLNPVRNALERAVEWTRTFLDTDSRECTQ